jgi:hypothetical protein
MKNTGPCEASEWAPAGRLARRDPVVKLLRIAGADCICIWLVPAHELIMRAANRPHTTRDRVQRSKGSQSIRGIVVRLPRTLTAQGWNALQAQTARGRQENLSWGQ